MIKVQLTFSLLKKCFLGISWCFGYGGSRSFLDWFTKTLLCSGADTVTAAETGSGKTHGYLVPLFDMLCKTGDN
ncbi:hypothetical protein ACH5RR_035688 [Cinchona calisaya]|uniref:Uncharacterized protein n=1 Tax=Cinchona calisaya TaxID=153742 RepID=A0ABD2Y0Y9_9GENT